MRRRWTGRKSGGLEGLVSSYRMESLPIVDSYGANNALSSAGVSVVVGKLGNGVLYNNGYSDLGNDTSLQLTEGTIECWFKTSGAGSSYRGLVAKVDAYNLLIIDNKPGFYSYANNTSYISTTLVNDGLWHHVALTFVSGGSLGTKIYLDGNLILSGGLEIKNQLSPLRIGSTNGTTQKILSTTIDEIRIWNRVLSQAEIQEYATNPISV